MTCHTGRLASINIQCSGGHISQNFLQGGNNLLYTGLTNKYACSMLSDSTWQVQFPEHATVIHVTSSEKNYNSYLTDKNQL